MRSKKARPAPGRTYVALLHPGNNRVILPIIDDDIEISFYVLAFAEPNRQAELRQQINRLLHGK
jgi:hypothetical protein